MWIVETLNETVKRELAEQPEDIRSRFRKIAEMITQYGLQNVHEPHVKHLQGPLWEMRLKGRDGIARAVYVTAFEQRVVVVRIFTKKTEETPRREIELALKRAKEVK